MSPHEGIRAHPSQLSQATQIKEKLHREDSSSSDSDTEKTSEPSAADAVKAKIYTLFGREKAVHQILGGGKPADVFVWRNEKVSAATVGGATAMWVFIIRADDYRLLTLACHTLILSLAITFLCSKATHFMNKSLPNIPVVSVSEDLAVNIALSLRYQINLGFAALRDITLGRDLKKFLAVIAGLWVLSILGNCCNFLTLFYIAFVMLHTMPVLPCHCKEVPWWIWISYMLCGYIFASWLSVYYVVVATSSFIRFLEDYENTSGAFFWAGLRRLPCHDHKKCSGFRLPLSCDRLSSSLVLLPGADLW
ncbi:hypothetical protein OPV22_014188 [Ensete ventricosum]|uniref:Reticulon-like protein n=1 Tax=Ensete ventricosum TaxID=4639 RepID=A0AAV8R7F5_ENSVE|nr:hypothetical protein OPV22_014188 [Ensete ventricosum]